MNYDQVCKKLDDRRNPHVCQSYILNCPNKDDFNTNGIRENKLTTSTSNSNNINETNIISGNSGTVTTATRPTALSADAQEYNYNRPKNQVPLDTKIRITSTYKTATSGTGATSALSPNTSFYENRKTLNDSAHSYETHETEIGCMSPSSFTNNDLWYGKLDLLRNLNMTETPTSSNSINSISNIENLKFAPINALIGDSSNSMYYSTNSNNNGNLNNNSNNNSNGSELDLKYAAREYRTAIYVYSMWNHFVDFLDSDTQSPGNTSNTNNINIIPNDKLIHSNKVHTNSNSTLLTSSHNSAFSPIVSAMNNKESTASNRISAGNINSINNNNNINSYTKQRRLPIFMKLANGNGNGSN